MSVSSGSDVSISSDESDTEEENRLMDLERELAAKKANVNMLKEAMTASDDKNSELDEVAEDVDAVTNSKIPIIRSSSAFYKFAKEWTSNATTTGDNTNSLTLNSR